MTTKLTTIDGSPVSGFAFGAMQFGGRADAKASQAMFDASREAGINHFDTAHVYTDGASERLLGSMIGAEREALLIASKVSYNGGAGPQNLQKQFDESRRRLSLDVVDVLYLHRFDPDNDLNETMDWFQAMRESGLIRYVGLSNFAAWQVMKAGGGQTVDIIQPMYNLVKRQAEVELLPMCMDQGIAVAPYSPLGGGLLTGKYAAEPAAAGRLSEDDSYAERYAPDWMHGAAADLALLAAELGTSPATLAVAWVAAHPAGPTPIVSARNAAQLAPSLAAMDFAMTAELYTRIAGLSPTPPPATDRLEEAAG